MLLTWQANIWHEHICARNEVYNSHGCSHIEQYSSCHGVPINYFHLFYRIIGAVIVIVGIYVLVKAKRNQQMRIV